MSSHNRMWAASTLQGRRWLMERRLEAVDQNDVVQLKELLSCQTVHRPKELTSALEMALLKKSDNYAPCIGLLLQEGANPCGTNGIGTPFLLLAADAGCIRIVQLLITAGCDMNQAREDGATALHRAAWTGHMACVSLLVHAGSDVSVRDAQGRSPLLLASQANKLDTTSLLLETGCDSNVSDTKGMTALLWATMYGNLCMVQTLLRNEASPNVQEFNGYSPLTVAAEKGDLDVLQLLLNNDANVNHVTNEGQSALVSAAQNRHLDCAHMLVSAGADVNACDMNNATALIYCMHDTSMVKDLIRAGANTNVRTKQNMTPLWLAVSEELTEAAKLVLKANCDPSEKAGPGEPKHPLQLAMYKGSLSLTKMIFVASFAMFLDLEWLVDYIEDTNFIQEAHHNPKVLEVQQWLENALEGEQNGFPSLLQLSRCYIREHLGCNQFCKRIDGLPLPGSMKEYLKLSEIDQM